MKHKHAKEPVDETFESLMQHLGIRTEVYEAAIQRDDASRVPSSEQEF
jgi:hypothetical protein